MSYPLAVIDDSRSTGFDTGVQDGPDQWRTPFYDKGDGLSFECLRDMIYTASKYQRASPMTRIQTNKGTAYLIDESDTARMECGLVRVQRTFASVPNPRNEYGIYTKTFQVPGNESGTIEEFTFTVPSRSYFEYALFPLQPIIAPRLAVLFGAVQYYGGANAPQQTGQEFPATDSECDRYKAGIYYRKTIYVRWPGP